MGGGGENRCRRWQGGRREQKNMEIMPATVERRRMDGGERGERTGASICEKDCGAKNNERLLPKEEDLSSPVRTKDFLVRKRESAPLSGQNKRETASFSHTILKKGGNNSLVGRGKTRNHIGGKKEGGGQLSW